MASSARAARLMVLLVVVSVVIMSGSVCHGARDISGHPGIFDPNRPGACGMGVCPGRGKPYTRPGGPYVRPSPPNNGDMSGAATVKPGPLDPNGPACIRGVCPSPGGSYTGGPGSPRYKMPPSNGAGAGIERP
ncbi:translation initiation factor IF-2 isoform X1 [Brachypodium distachyon]|uniref:Uncharacterized protein n=1 Tax=Brachypodium distachyon TaxID=15368 RepID=A0A2K2DN49_BRADI|nr:translation initiation factor IF-2 isoform X1 [Brachypodium distachyon]PNT75712.1 hypothetical protein BRADI_1g37112v3 [Brachypodium distachyon]|eukprot:XP_003560624.2 translation initiation factor IF-2 isoform X1 [Brachypodium distachyon]